MFADRKDAVRVGTDENGNIIYMRRGKRYTVGSGAGQPGFYPGGSRRAAYEGGTDRRNTNETAEFVRASRAAGRMNRHVSPGQQSWSR